MPTLNAHYSNLEQCLEESDDALGLVILEILQAQEKENRNSLIKQPLNRGLIESALSSQTMPKPFDYQFTGRFETKIEDAWRWLIETKLIRPGSGQDGLNGFATLTELGLRTTKDQRALLEAGRVLPENLIHPRILVRIKPDFRGGLYDKAVQDAFKQVETEARQAAGLDEVVSGEDVFKRAFQKESPLYKHTRRPNDVRELFCVAYRMHRHGPSHGNTVIEPFAAARMLVLASHLLFQLEEIRAKAGSSHPSQG
jgi:hypothetical protein